VFLRLIALVVLFRIARLAFRIVNRLRRRVSIASLRERYGSGWAVVTGSSSGIGLAFAEELAAAKFNVLLIARREESLREIADRIKRTHSVKTEWITFDFSHAFENADYLMDRVNAITEGDVAVVVHMAGNSDLSRHFTDKPLHRNLEIMRLNCEGTLVMLQLFCPLLAARKHRSAIITPGALTAYVPQPGLSVSSGNKHFVRGLTLAASYEFGERIDIMCAHPLAVRSEILRGKGAFVSISTQTFARSVLSQLGTTNESNGPFGHDVFLFIWRSIPEWLFDMWTWKLVPNLSDMLDRPVDMRDVREKFKER